MNKKNLNTWDNIFFVTVVTLCLFMFSGFIWSSFCQQLLEEDKFSILLLVLLLVVSLANLLPISFLFYCFSIKNKNEAPKTFKPFIYWQYDCNFFREFKAKEFKEREKEILKELVGSIRFFSILFGVLILIPVLIAIIIHKELKLFNFFFIFTYPIIMALAIFFAYQKQTHVREKKECLSIESPFFKMNSQGFELNRHYEEIYLQHNRFGIVSIKLTYKFDALCFECYTKKTDTFPNWEYGDTIHTISRTHYIPIPPSKVEDAKNMIAILEKNHNIKIVIEKNEKTQDFS